MDDQHLERLASNNPAMTLPGNVRFALTEGNTKTHHESTSEGSTSGSDTRVVTDPAGDMSKITSSTSPQQKSKYDVGWRRIVRNFGPSWFSVTMGTGIVSLLFITIPFHANWLYWLAVIFLGLNIIIFSLATIASLIRYIAYPEIWTVMIHDPTNSLFLGTAPMGFATIIEGVIFLCLPYWAPGATIFAWVLWMIDSVASIAVTVSLSFILISSSHLQSLDRITAAQLLPIAATIVASGAGAEMAESLLKYHHSPNYALATLVTSYVMWGMSTPFAIFTLMMYYQRLAVHKLPPREIIVSSFLPLGPLGMGGYTIMYLGLQARAILPQVPPFLSHIPMAGDILYILGLFTALIMWAFGLVWFVYALAAIYSCGSFPFNMGWWGFTFPLGVMAVSTIQLGIEFPSLFFRVLGTVFAVMVIILWVVVFTGTVKGALSGQLFYAPCLKNLPKDSKHGACVVMDDKSRDMERRKIANDVDVEKGD